MRVGLATTVLLGTSLLVSGQLSLLFFLGFLFAAVRLYDPIGLVLQNMAATFSSKLQIDRMRNILEQPFQKGKNTCVPNGYNIIFDNVDFSYRECEGVQQGSPERLMKQDGLYRHMVQLQQESGTWQVK